MQGYSFVREDQQPFASRHGAARGRIAGRAIRSVGVAALLAITAVFLMMTLPPIVGGGQLMAPAFAGERDSGGNGGEDGDAKGNDEDNDDGDEDNDDGDEDNDDGDEDNDDGDEDSDSGNSGKGRDRGASDGSKSGGNKGGNKGVGKAGAKPNAVGHGEADSGDEDGEPRGQDVRAGGEGADGTSAGPTSGDLTDIELEDHAAATVTTPGLEAFRATVLTADEEAAAIAAGWTPAD